jgi:novobiocin biosynthesis protein NovU/D-mycarose 3-C-methyltransferase
VQLLDVVDPEILLRNYLYVTGTSDTIAAHNESYARAVVEALELGRDDFVVEVASNDGSLLARFREHGVRTLGIEPARNIAAVARERGIETIERFFEPACARDVRRSHGPAQAVIGNNVLAHVDDPVAFLAGARHMLAPGGRVIVEVPELSEMVSKLEYDTVYHEHLSYFSVTSLTRVCEEAGLRIARVDRVAVHGGSVRVWAGAADQVRDHSEAVRELAERERADGLTSLDRLRAFARDVEAQRAALLELLRRLKASGKSVGGYGAPAKGNTLLNYCGITTELLPYTVDKSPLKVGLFTPGSHIPVLPASELLARQPDYCLILAWNFADEIARQQQEYARRGGRFVVPIPMPRVLE